MFYPSFVHFFVLYYLIFHRIFRRALNNHVIIVLLLIGLVNELTSVLWILHRYHFGSPLIRSPAFYLCSFFFDYAFFTTQVILFAWASIERHILIFHIQWYSTRRKLFFFHYLSIMVVVVYCMIYYTIITFGPFCRNTFASFLAGGYIIPCVFKYKILATGELLFHQIMPTLIIIICSLTLIVRVLQQKRRMNRPMVWRAHRKMTIQLVSISVLYLVLNAPWVSVLFASQYGLSANLARIYTFYGLYLRMYIIFLYPFVCFASSAELRGKFQSHFLSWTTSYRLVVHRNNSLELR